MPLNNLQRVDLNLLVALQVLLEERSVTRSAERLFITQPAMSKTLQRLRVLFDDELFVRSGRELIPTSRAEELYDKLPELLLDIDSVVTGRGFNPKEDVGYLHIATPEFMAVEITEQLVRRLSTEAPNVSLAISNKLEKFQHYLREGDLDFVLAVDTKVSEEFVSTPAGGFSPSIWMRRGHPLADVELNLENVLQFPFVQYFLLQSSESISPHVETRFDKALAELGLQRKRMIVTDQLMTALYAVKDSDCLMLSTEDDLIHQTKEFDLIRKPYPVDLYFVNFIPVSLFQHKRTMQSPLHRWFKALLQSIIEKKRENNEIS